MQITLFFTMDLCSLLTCTKTAVFSSGCGDGMLCDWDAEKKEYSQSRSNSDGVIVALPVHDVPCRIMFFRLA